jgi:integrase
MSDGNGLCLRVMPNGGKYWQWEDRRPVTKTKNVASYGTYPDVSIQRAREKHAEARKLLKDKIDPNEHKAALEAAGRERAANSVEVVALEFLDKKARERTAETNRRTRAWFTHYVFPAIGHKPITAVEAPDILAMLRKIADKGILDTAHRVRGELSAMFRFAIATGRTKSDPAAPLIGALPPAKGKHFAAITDPVQVGQLLRAIWGYDGSPLTTAALKILPMVFTRPGELRAAHWADIDLDAAEWRYYILKTDTHHIVPLATQVVEVLRELQPLTGRGAFVFPGARGRDRPMSENTINAALRRLGYDSDTMTAHGFRSTARTILDEVLGVRPDYLEHQLAHEVRDPNGRSYNRTAHLKERQKMMQAWADYLDTLRIGGNVIPLRRAA